MSDTQERPVSVSPVSKDAVDPQFEKLKDGARRTLEEGLYGMCFGPYIGEQRPGAALSPSQIEERIAIIAPYTKWIRTFSCTNGNDQIPGIARKYGLKTLVGAWIGKNLKENESEISGLLEIASRGEADRIAVGNEVMYRKDLRIGQLLDYIRRVKEYLPEFSVNCVDTAKDLLVNPQIADVSDSVMVNFYPYWEKADIEDATDCLEAMFQQLAAVFRGKKVVFTETGWPSAGSVNGAAIPSLFNFVKYFMDTQKWARRQSVDVFHFSSFDEAWKIDHEGDVGPHWGIWDKEGAYKFAPGKA